jgi:histidine phosphotransferase ChpT
MVVAALTMIGVLDLRVCELLTARLCHELIGPIGAVGNGVELLDEGDPDFVGDALTLVRDSARRAANRLRFYRFCYGFSGSAAIAGPAPCESAAALFDGVPPIACDFTDRVRALPLDQQKLGCNLILVGAEALGHHGGQLVLDTAAIGLQLEVIGGSASLTPEQAAALRLETPIGAVTPQTAQAYFAGLLARACGWRLAAAALEPGRFRVYSIEPGV